MEQDNIIHQNRFKKFIKAIGLYAIGNLGSRLITFLMVPMYTYFVNPADLGLYDISLSLIIAFIPIMTLQLRDGAFRFLINNDNVLEKKNVVSFVCKELLLSTILVVVTSVLLHYMFSPLYLMEIILLLLVMAYYEVLAQVARAIGGAAVFANSSLICSFGIGVFSLVFVYIFECGLSGIFIANIMARVAALLYVIITVRLNKYFSISDNLQLRKNILKYVLPLLPGALCWCLLDCCGRVFIERKLGLEASGLFAVSVRFSSIIYTFAIIFIQAWQETAIVNYKTKDKDRFFSEIFNAFIYYVSFIIVMLNFGLKLNYGWIVDSAYKESLVYIYPLTIGVGFCVFSHFLDLGYQCSKETKRALPSLVCALVVNVVFNAIFIEVLRIWAPIIANILSFVTMSIYRFYDVKKYFRLCLSKSSVLVALILVISMLSFYLIKDTYIDILYILCLMVVYIMILPDTLKKKLKIK